MEDEYIRNACLRDTWRQGNMECAVVPINPNSNGIWPTPKLADPKANIPYYEYTFPYLEITFLIIFFLWLSFHFFLRRLGMIRFTSQILTGILLSKSVFKEHSSIRHLFSTHDYKETVLGLWGGFAYTMFWFLMGVKMDVGLIRGMGKKAITIGVSSALLSVLACSICYFMNVFYVGAASGGQSLSVGEAVVIYAVQCLSTFPVVGNLLFELNIQNSELGRLAMSSAVISDFIGSIVSALLIFVKELEAEKTRLGRLFVGDIQNGSRSVHRSLIVVVFIFFAIYVFRPLMFYIIKRTPEGRPVNSHYINALVVFVFGSAVLAHMCKQFVPMGPFILGLAVPHGPPLGSVITERFEPAIFGVFLPLFATTSATEVDIGTLLDKSSLPKNFQAIRLMLLTFVIKVVSTAVPARMFHMPAVDSLALSFILSFVGVFELGSYALAFQRGTIRPETFSITSLYILVSSAIIPPILRYMYDPSRIYAGYKNRNMMNLKPNSELRVVSGIYRTDDIRPMINLLEATCPTKDSPVAAYVLHLIELIGRANPVFVSHRMQTRKSGNLSYSDNVIISFEQFRKDFFGTVAISTYTAMSTPKGMHDDICMVALNNDTSLIVLPFHQTWSADGLTVVSDSKMIRSLNESVLELSPCSVGIFAYRSSSGRRTISDTASQNSLYRICMIFLGGQDDREALSLAKRMACDSRISLTVVHLVSSDFKISEQTDWETMLDSVQIRDVKNRIEGSEHATYVEEVLKDASDTPKLLKSMATDYDMFIVGRGKGRNSPLTRGLEQWSEFKELGVIGDLLISQDVNCQASVLLVQQQKLMI